MVQLGYELKTHRLASLMPPWYNTAPGSRLLAILAAIGESDADLTEIELITSAMRIVRDGLFVGTATGAALSVIGQNFGIKRPVSAETDDEIYRKIIKAVAFGPRGSLKTIYDVVEAFLGPQETAGWQIFDPGGNLLVIWVRNVSEDRAPFNATYLHKDATFDGGPASPLMEYPGDYFMPNPLYPGATGIIKSGVAGSILPGPTGNDASVFVGALGNGASGIVLPGQFTGNYAQPGKDILVTLSGCADARNDKRAETISLVPTAPVSGFDYPADMVINSSAYGPGNTIPADANVPTTFYTETHTPLPSSLVTNHFHRVTATPTANLGEVASTLFADSASGNGGDANNGAISWKLGDLFNAGQNIFVQDDVGSTILVENAAVPDNNRVAKVIGYVNASTVVVEPVVPGDMIGWVTDANNGTLQWSLYRGVLSNAVTLTGNTILRDLATVLEIVKMAGIVIKIGDATT